MPTLQQEKNFMKILNIFSKILHHGNRGAVAVVITSIQCYQKTLSPDHGILRNIRTRYRCRFIPSCSEYAIGSLRQYGLIMGIMASVGRLLHCNPFCAGGYDPVGKISNFFELQNSPHCHSRESGNPDYSPQTEGLDPCFRRDDRERGNFVIQRN